MNSASSPLLEELFSRSRLGQGAPYFDGGFPTSFPSAPSGPFSKQARRSSRAAARASDSLACSSIFERSILSSSLRVALIERAASFCMDLKPSRQDSLTPSSADTSCSFETNSSSIGFRIGKSGTGGSTAESTTSSAVQEQAPSRSRGRSQGSASMAPSAGHEVCVAASAVSSVCVQASRVATTPAATRGGEAQAEEQLSSTTSAHLEEEAAAKAPCLACPAARLSAIASRR
mmetsp:Transcript_1489/g.4562  ORF Transcript_1489/g.4562 Transcript_1489/m.4562 type:complete len:232 (+) Transcript_1489:356-1051(+)